MLIKSMILKFQQMIHIAARSARCIVRPVSHTC